VAKEPDFVLTFTQRIIKRLLALRNHHFLWRRSHPARCHAAVGFSPPYRQPDSPTAFPTFLFHGFGQAVTLGFRYGNS